MIDVRLISSLITSIKNGNSNDFDKLFTLTSRILLHGINSILNDYEASQDILQDTYVKMLSSDFKEGSENGLAFLNTIAKNLALNEYNKRKRYLNIDLEQNEDLMYEEKPKPSESPLLDLLPKILTPYEVQLVLLHDVDDLSHQEIAKIMKKPLGTITWHYSKAVKKIRKKVNDDGTIKS